MGDKFVNAVLSELNQFDLPPIHSIFPFECQPDYLVHAQRANEVMFEGLEITDPVERLKFIQLKVPWFMSMIQPKGQDDERMFLSVLITTMFFVFDDFLELSRVESGKELRDGLLKIVEGDSTSSKLLENPLFFLFDKAVSRLREMMTPSLYYHFLGSIINFVDACVDEIVQTQQASIPNPNEFRYFRRHTSLGVAVTAVFGEFIMGLQLNESDRQSSAYTDLVGEVIDHCLLVNDVLSFRKEYYKRNQQKTSNWLLVLLHAGRCSSFQDAVYEVCQMIQDSEARILKLQNELVKQAKSDDNGDLLKLADALPLCASGNLQWSYCTSRYHGVNNPLINNKPFHGTWIMHPERTIILPPKPPKAFLVSAFRRPHRAAGPPSFAFLA